jgi:hypothetical protein
MHKYVVPVTQASALLVGSMLTLVFFSLLFI